MRIVSEKLPDLNLYNYARGNPLKYIDPLGTDAVLVTYGGYHDVVWVGPDANGNYLGYSLEPNYGYVGAGWSFLSGKTLAVTFKEKRRPHTSGKLKSPGKNKIHFKIDFS